MFLEDAIDCLARQARWNRMLIFHLVSTIHLFWAYCIFNHYGSQINLDIFLGIVGVLKSYNLVAALYFCSALLGYFATMRSFKQRLMRPFLLIPQQFLLTWPALQALNGMFNGNVDHVSLIVVAAYHSVALYYNFISGKSLRESDYYKN